MSRPKISVITITFNSEEHLEDAIKSFINQKYENKEYIIIDGSSSDKTIDIVNKYREYIAYFISEPDKGISDAFNKGIVAATGDLIGILNSDDILTEDALRMVANQYDENYDVFRGSQIVKNYETGYEYMLNPTSQYDKLPFAFQICHMSTYITKIAFEKYGYYDIGYKNAMDFELLFRFNRQGAKEKKIEGIFGIFRLGGVSQIKYKQSREERCRVVTLYFGKFGVITYRMVLLFKEIIKKILGLVGKDLWSRIRYKKGVGL